METKPNNPEPPLATGSTRDRRQPAGERRSNKQGDPKRTYCPGEPTGESHDGVAQAITDYRAALTAESPANP